MSTKSKGLDQTDVRMSILQYRFAFSLPDAYFSAILFFEDPLATWRSVVRSPPLLCQEGIGTLSSFATGSGE